LRDALNTPLQSPDVGAGWHVIRDGNFWCAVGPKFEDLVRSPSAWGSTPEEARTALVSRHQRQADDPPEHVPPLPEFRIWQ
jgi:hypothetical protein